MYYKHLFVPCHWQTYAGLPCYDEPDEKSAECHVATLTTSLGGRRLREIARRILYAMNLLHTHPYFFGGGMLCRQCRTVLKKFMEQG